MAPIGLVLVTVSLIAAIILCLFSLILVTTHYRLNVDFGNKTFRHCVWILGFKNGDREKFETIEYLFIKKNKVSQRMHHMVMSTTIHQEVYDGYLRFSEKNKIHLTTCDRKEDLIKILKTIAARLRVRIFDYSEGQPVEV